MEKKGHVPVAMERPNWYRCTICGLAWTMCKGRKMPNCQGVGTWQEHPMHGLTYSKPSGSGLVWNGVDVHNTHQLRWLRGIIYCSKCGYYSSYRVRSLSLPCKMMAPKRGSPRLLRLKRMEQGLHPTLSTLPTGDHQAPATLTPHLWG